MEKGTGIGTMRNRHVEWYRAGAGGPHEGATRILASTAQAWEVR